MIYYHFTNDTRFDNFRENIKSVSKHIETGEWENSLQDLTKAKNGWYPIYCFYFGLYKGSKNVELVLNGEVDYVLSEFIKKFQFPNPKKDKTKTFEKEVENKELIAPLRLLVKILFYASQYGERNYITKAEFENYILANDSIIYNDVSISGIYDEIMEKTIDDGFFQKNVEVNGGDKNRFATQLIGLLSYFNFIDDNKGKISLNTKNLSTRDKEILYDIITFDGYWESSEIEDKELMEQSYKDYLQYTSNIDGEVSNITKTSSTIKGINKIFYGAPGTGKSFLVSEKYGHYKRVTFHPEYTYFDFVGGLKPTTNFNEDSKSEFVTYEFIPGPFTETLLQALENEKEDFGLIIEEMNRANTASVFGDIFQLLDRKIDGESKYSINNIELIKYLQKKLKDYSINKIIIPSNLSLIATMNSSDQGVFVMDSAFKRRWEFEYIAINFLESEYGNEQIAGFNLKWKDFGISLNKVLSNMGIDEDKLIGPYFLNQSELSDVNKISSKLLIYLWDDVVRYDRDRLFVNEKQFSELVRLFKDGKPIFSDILQNELNLLAEFGSINEKNEVDEN